LPPFPDSKEGIERLRRKYTVVTCTNSPLGLQCELTLKSGILFDGYSDFSELKVYKPAALAYRSVCFDQKVNPDEVMMVTGNPTFAHYDYGDCEMARKLGMQAQLIRHGKPNTIIELAEQLGC
jgi:2-haloacid dehalogenase